MRIDEPQHVVHALVSNMQAVAGIGVGHFVLGVFQRVEDIDIDVAELLAGLAQVAICERDFIGAENGVLALVVVDGHDTQEYDLPRTHELHSPTREAEKHERLPERRPGL